MDPHRSNDNDDRDNIDILEYLCNGILRHTRCGMDIRHCHLLRDPWMTLPARMPNICWIDGRFRIGAWQDPMRAVTRCAIRHCDITRLALQAMKAVNETLQASYWQPVLFIQIGGFVAWSTGGFRDSRRAHRRSGIAG